MSQVQLMNLAIQKVEWLSTRQAILAQNVANVNTPGYHAKDIIPFESYLDNTQLSMAKSNGTSLDPTTDGADLPKTEEVRGGDSTFSGNNVSLENELLKLGQTNSQFALDTGLIKSFNRMIMASLKG
jgi:flagellar basal-body rod protein FlgB